MPSFTGNCDIVVIVTSLSPCTEPPSNLSFEVGGEFYVRRNDGSEDVHRLTSWSTVLPFDMSEKLMRKSIIDAAIARAKNLGYVVGDNNTKVVIGQPQVF